MNEITLLPQTLREHSLSDREIVLPYPEALEALELLVAADWAFLGWEGWEKDAEGRYGHSGHFMGTTCIDRERGEKWADYVQRSARFCRETIEADQERWNRECADSSRTLYFCLTATANEGKAAHGPMLCIIPACSSEEEVRMLFSGDTGS